MSTATTEPIRYEPETGRLIGTNMPAIPDVIAFARDKGFRFIQRFTWVAAKHCGCVMGVAAAMKDDGTPPDGMEVDEAADSLALTYAVAGYIGFGFDGNILGSSAKPQHMVAAFDYGQAAAEAVTAAGLWTGEEGGTR